jgi:hypothetical protein
MSLTGFSQIDTNNRAIKCFPISMVKKIAKDLVSGDSAKAQLTLTEKQLSETENKVIMKDSVIGFLQLKELEYKKIITIQDEKNLILQKNINDLEFNIKKEKFKYKLTSGLSGISIITMMFLLIIK